ncbi:MAG TPA: SUMF1/EgtB/PvdO family nonheme iron enzyme [Rhodothermales bacterium]|nr:SUMF1/EgtB/PvdO family nonheme iron enzyme [Rhodothermales bacterium]
MGAVPAILPGAQALNVSAISNEKPDRCTAVYPRLNPSSSPTMPVLKYILLVSLLALCAAWAGGIRLNQGAQSTAALDGTGKVTTPLRADTLQPYQEKIAGTLVALDMIPVPAGTITVQAEGGPKTVQVGPFWIEKTELPWEVYDAFVYGMDKVEQGSTPEVDAISRPSRPYMLPGESFGHEDHPALGMTYKAAQHFTEWLSARTGHTYRLPTEAEWTYACRAGQPEPTGAQLKEIAWYFDNASDKTHERGTLAPNEWGIQDMLGNTAEWFGDSGEKGAVIGGSWKTDAAGLNCSTTQPYSPEWQMTDPQIPKSTWWLSDGNFVGMRVIRVPE